MTAAGIVFSLGLAQQGGLMAWVELVPLGAILLLAAWIFLRPFPGRQSGADPGGASESADGSAAEKGDQHQEEDK